MRDSHTSVLSRLMIVIIALVAQPMFGGAAQSMTREHAFFAFAEYAPDVPDAVMRRGNFSDIETYIERRCRTNHQAAAMQAWMAGRLDVLNYLESRDIRVELDLPGRPPIDSHIRDAWVALMTVAIKPTAEGEALLQRALDPMLNTELGKELVRVAEDRRRFDFLRLALRRGASFNVPADRGIEVAKAARAVAINDLEALRREDAEVLRRARDLYGRTLLHLAVLSGGDVSLVQLLLVKGVDPSAGMGGGPSYSALALSGYISAPEVVEALAQSMRGVPAAQEAARYALHNAVEAGNLGVIEVLLRRGAALESMLTLACRTGDVETAKYLLSLGADVNERDRFGITPLMVASSEGSVELIRLLLSKGARVNDVARDGSTALMSAAAGSSCDDAVELLIKSGAEANATTSYDIKWNEGGYRALNWALAWGTLASVQLLAQHTEHVENRRLWGTKPEGVADTAEASSVPLEQLRAAPTELIVGGERYAMSISWRSGSPPRYRLAVEIRGLTSDRLKGAEIDRLWVIREDWIWETIPTLTCAGENLGGYRRTEDGFYPKDGFVGCGCDGPQWGPWLKVDVVARLRLQDGRTQMIRLPDQEIQAGD